MRSADSPIVIATRGSALALAQTNCVLAQCRTAFPAMQCVVKIVKTTGDRLQTLSLDNPNQQVTKGLFTKELEVALLENEADLAVHSLKDLPTELPAGLILGAVSRRADARDLLIYRDAEFSTQSLEGRGLARGFAANSTIHAFPSGATIATSSTRRHAQLLALRPDLKVVPIRGNVGTRLQKLAENAEIDALVLAVAGIERLHFSVSPTGALHGEGVPPGLLAVYLSTDEMLPCVGQGALGLEIRAGDARAAHLCEGLNDISTFHCVTAERAFLHAMGGGCLSPVAAYAEMLGGQLHVRALSFRGEKLQRAEIRGAVQDAVSLGKELAARFG